MKRFHRIFWKRGVLLNISIILVMAAACTLQITCAPTASVVPAEPSVPEKIPVDSSVTDADGNVYHTVQIGTQLWTVENLRTTKYNDGTPIPFITEKAAWCSLTTPGYCLYNNTADVDSIAKYGAEYNWFAVQTGKLAPGGWRVPSSNDWSMLHSYLANHDYSWNPLNPAQIAKSLATKNGWRSSLMEGTPGYDTATNNTSGFSAYPVGAREPDGNFGGRGTIVAWWSSTETNTATANYQMLRNNYESLFGFSGMKNNALAVRLIKGE